MVFTAAQHGQTIHAKGYELSPLRTGYETVIAQRTSKTFATTAQQSGTVIKVTKEVISVKYEDGSVEHIKLGKIHGSAAGTNYPYELVTNLKNKDTFEIGDTLAYNNSFFKEDRYSPGQASWKAGVMGRIAFMENMDTLEDGSVISERVSKLLETEVAEIRTITLRFDQVITELVNVGDKVDLDSILCVIQDPEVAAIAGDDEASETLKRLSSNTPRAKHVGVISKIECFYHGDYEDMDESVLKIATELDELRVKEAKVLNKTPTTGQDDGSLRIEGNMLEPFNMAIRIYIDRDLTCKTGDKLVFFNQMKSVISKVMSGENYCEDGTPLDIQFAKTSIDARQVVSPLLQSTTNLLLKTLTKHVVDLYRGKTNARAK